MGSYISRVSTEDLLVLGVSGVVISSYLPTVAIKSEAPVKEGSSSRMCVEDYRNGGGGYPKVINMKEYELISRDVPLPARSNDPAEYEAELDRIIFETMPMCLTKMSTEAFVPMEQPRTQTVGQKLHTYKIFTECQTWLRPPEPREGH